ncbi:SAICAR synthase-like protein [Aureobasidium pullulans]|uniref:SAICAR synthase-like protein n=1 Tax=Aureobasidium pullulans TaxID=5580 RepID=A0A4S9D1U2_AURPU|nr:SAICAR synthase-like protein [Aureobasidium pullulans]THX28858.1 SAICAR synthase-like protein [Aureobasidium pullulans]THX37911.1 SAICAR synthase-like protein [Aureobasidium pullulans]
MARQQKVARSIVYAILENDGAKVRSLLSRILTAIAYFFALYQLSLIRLRNDVFKNLRNKWQVDDEDYKDSFGKKDGLQAKGDMGFSGSTFYTTSDGAYLVKSVPRGFEHSFFRDDFLEPYYDHMLHHTKSLLVRITDFLSWSRFGIGGILGTAPTHHIVMENILIGKDKDNTSKWETWDLKPTSYFFPERDIAGGKLTSDDTKDRLADKFEDKILLTQSQADEFFELLSQDTELLERCNAVDYSLFLVRIPLINSDGSAAYQSQEEAIQQSERPPFVPPTHSWRTGVYSADQKFVFRAVVLDFFWAKHKLHAKAMTWLIKAWNLIDRQGPMSITTTPEEYRQRFLSMCHEMVEIKE